MRRAFTVIEVMIFVAILLAIIGAIITASLMDKSPKRLAVSRSTDAIEWMDEKTGKRYLVFTAPNGGLFVIEAPLTVEKK